MFAHQATNQHKHGSINRSAKIRPTDQSGYAALLTVIVIGAVLIIIGTGLTLTSINGLQSVSARQLSDQVENLAEACAHEALLKLRSNSTLPAQVVLPELTCPVQQLSQSGQNWTFTVTATLNGYTRAITITANRASSITITNWQITQ